MTIIAFIGFFLFVALYAAIASAVIYHLKAYVLPGWNGAAISVWLFTLFSVALFGLAIYFFLQVPWEMIIKSDA